MRIKIITLVKQVPDTQNISCGAMNADGTINRSALPSITNPEDLNALEEALKIKALCGGTITTLSMGLPSAVNALKACLYRGAENAILVTDPKFAASDTLATSYALVCAIKKIGTFDLIICGRQAIDGDTAQVGPQVAEKLAINQITCVAEIISVNDQEITVKRAIDNGYEIVKSRLPILLTVINEANEPRFPSAKLALRYKNICCKNSNYDDSYIFAEDARGCDHIKQWSAADIKADLSRCGLSGSPTKVKKIENVVLAASSSKNIADTEGDITNLMHELKAEHIIC